jgi:2-polyprenyl-3-methyl-5-hydroxy-6-metoxy-1,4-benzoquinol methylase
MPAFAALRRSERSNFSPCELCGNSLFVIVADQDRLGNPLQTVVCHSCGLVSVNPRPSDEDIDQFYRDEYRKSYKQSLQPKLKHVYRAGRVALNRLSYLLPLLHQSRTVLDLGAGGGELLFMLRGLGFDVQGIEPNTGYGDAARDVLGLPVQVTTYQQAQVELESCDMVTCFHVLEHLPHPVDALAAMVRWMKPEGLLLIEVPHVMSRCQWPHSRHHIGHLHHFSSSTLALAGQKAGLRAVDVFTSGDGGNLMVVFRKNPGGSAKAMPSTIPGHAQRVISHLRTHTALAHLLSPHPYVRPLERMCSHLGEHLALMRCRNVQVLLGRLLEEARSLARSAREGTPPLELPISDCRRAAG